MKTQEKIRNLLLLGVTLLLTGMLSAACSVSESDLGSDELSDADLEAIGQVIGESVSGENDGLMASIYDATAEFTETGMDYTASSKYSDSTPDLQDDSGRGSEKNWSYSYDPETGTHTIEFSRSVFRGEYSKGVDAKYEYIFKDLNGAFIARPKAERERIETLDFFGDRSGSIEAPNRSSAFSRTDTLYLVGISDSTEILGINGNHHGEGSHDGVRDNGDEVSGNYVLDAQFTDIEIDKALVTENGSLEEGVFGTITYQLEWEKVVNDNVVTKTVSGSLEMNGDGTALLRFNKFERVFLIHLREGDIE
ncbi:MAG: hypothetical protein R3211_00740 [Balneolaceae bacterium]|nr:hypothetical protein [Balneolaceae bacterium]